MLKKSTIQLLRFPFSFFLMPVFWFALSMQEKINWLASIALFFILHVLVYPSSNGYNSLQDQDKGSIGGLENPPLPDKQLSYITRLMDVLAIIWTNQFLGWDKALWLLIYIVFSRLYSFRGIRLKKYPIIGYLTVVLNQGGLIFVLVSLVSSNIHFNEISPLLIIAAILLIGGFYPITQIYQHEQDKADGVTTISMLLGKRGTFVFCGLLYAISFALLAFHFQSIQKIYLFFILQMFFIPVVVFFLFWAIQVWKDERNADFKRTMRMNWIASFASNLGFITLLILKHNG
jgi:1,4-dihydroxy-2-naphthoate octaprenyltransferase